MLVLLMLLPFCPLFAGRVNAGLHARSAGGLLRAACIYETKDGSGGRPALTARNLPPPPKFLDVLRVESFYG